MRRPSRRLRAATASFAAGVLAASTATTGVASAGPTGPEPLAAIEQSATAITPPSPAKTLTLITGDRVSVSLGPDGRPIVQKVTPAPRANGKTASFQTIKNGKRLYVIPSDAASLIGEHRLDLGLFDVGYLAANGYADNATTQLPLIVQYPTTTSGPALSAQADALPDSTATRTLGSIHAAAVAEDKAHAGGFWSTLITGGSAQPSKIWLDRKVHVDLDQSVPQIGAPVAWAAGLDGTGSTVAILDTGIDATHPDLAGKITQAQNFTPDPDAVDHFGHGTHVASIVAGTGAASGGKYKGVAPGAKLMIGKVLANTGSGDESWIIAGMQWAAQQHARIVNMSLGGDPSDGTDPMSQAADDLSAQYGTLFVVAAGNSGPGIESIQSPGAADAALTVAAVDKSDHLASFSSRGPRLQDHGFKPDIAAPGVNITAARASGTLLGQPVGQYYTTASGTSMATPHVAGAASILAEEHPDWTGPQLKAALMSTAKDDGYPPLEQGAGRVDVARAFGQNVYAVGSVDFGHPAYPQRAAITKSVTYINDTDESVALALHATLHSFKGASAPPGMLTLDRPTVTVPAHGTASARVTIDPRKAIGAGEYDGAVHASDTAGAIAVTTAIGIYDSPRSAKLTVAIKPRTGTVPVRTDATLILRMDGHEEFDGDPIYLPNGSGSIALANGPYMVGTYVSWKDAKSDWNAALPIAPQVDLSRDTTVRFDLNRAKEVQLSTPKPSETYDAWFGYQRVDATNRLSVVPVIHAPFYGTQNYWMLPTTKVTQGSFRFVSEHLLGAPLVQMTTAGRDGVKIDARYQSVDLQYPKLEGRIDLPLVYAGPGRPDDFAGLDVRGKLVLLSLADICPDRCRANALDRVTNAANAGAAAVLGFSATGRAFLDAGGPQVELHPGFAWPTYPIPTLSIPADEGTMLVSRLGHHAETVHVDGTQESPYLYSLRFANDGSIPVDLHHVVGVGNLYRVGEQFHDEQPGQVSTQWEPQQSGDLFSTYVANLHPWLNATTSTPKSRTDYYGPASKNTLWARQFYDSDGSSQESLDVFDKPGTRQEVLGGPVAAPGASSFPSIVRAASAGTDFSPDATLCQACRTNDTFTPMFNPVDGENHLGSSPWWSSPAIGGNMPYEQHLYGGDGEEIPMQIGRPPCDQPPCLSFQLPTYVMPAESAKYRYSLKYSVPGQAYGSTVDSSWTFTSGRPTGSAPAGYGCWGQLLDGIDANAPCRAEHLLFLKYGIDLGMGNTVPAGSTHAITVTGYDTWQAPTTAVESLDLSVTFDDGAHWHPVPTRAIGHDKYTADITSPALGHTTGAVGLRVHADDAEGNTIDQTIDRAFGLT